MTMETQSVEMDDLLTAHPSKPGGSVQILSIRESPFVLNEPLVKNLTSHRVSELNNQYLDISASLRQ